MRRVFVETGAFVALRNRSEREHERARDALSTLAAGRIRLFTSNHVLAETYTALLRRVGREEAIDWGRRLREGKGIAVVGVEHQVEEAAWAILEEHPEPGWSYVDATTLALMASEGASEIFTFDHRFAEAGLEVVPSVLDSGSAVG